MHRTRLLLLMAVHVGLAACTYVFSKHAVNGFPDSAALTMARALGAALVFMALTGGGAIPRPHFSPREWLRVLVLGVLLVPLNQYFFLKGLRQTVPSHPALFYALTPLGVLILAAIQRRKRPPSHHIVGVAMALLGVVTVLRPWESGSLATELRAGDFWNLCAVVCWVFYTAWAGRFCQDHDPRVLTAWSLILGALAMLPLGGPALAAMDFSAVTFLGWSSLAWLVIVTSVVMMQLWNLLLRHLSPEQVAICANAQPPATALLSALLAGMGALAGPQDLGPLFWLGMMLILAGSWQLQRFRS